MRYEPIGQKEQKSILIDSFGGGVNLSKPPNAIEDNELSEALNVWYKDGFLQKRPGICGDIEKIIWQEDISSYDTVKYRAYNNPVYLDDKEYKVITVCRTDFDSYERYYVYLVASSGEVKSAGVLHFGRIDSTLFYMPANIVFFSGKATSGGGIYAVVTCYNMENPTQKIYNIYEVDESFNDWYLSVNYYMPTIYINGRGNRYEEALEVGYAFSGSPKRLESVNMLNGGFKAYFTSDGYSSMFSLPVSELAYDTEIKCRIYIAPDIYTEWVIPQQLAGATEIFSNQEVTLVADREKGLLSFTSATGNFSIPIMSQYNRNNICVTAYKETENGKANIASSTLCTGIGNTLIFSGGIEKNKVYCSKTDNPLYFPESSVIKVGDTGAPVTCLNVFKGNIYAFKENSIYKLNIKEGKLIDEDIFIPDNSEALYTADTLTVKNIGSNAGTVYPETVKLCGDNITWLGTDNEVYSMSTSGGIRNISFNIKKLLSQTAEQFHSYHTICFATVADGNYMLFFANKVFVMSFSVKGVRYPSSNWKTREENCSWYYWELCDKACVFGGFYHSNKINFLCGDKSSGISYIAALEGESDIILKRYTEDDIVTEKSPIAAIAATRLYDMGNVISKKFIERLSISAAGDVKVEYLAPSPLGEYQLISDDSEVLYTPGNQRFTKLLSTKGVRMFGLKFTTDKKFSLEAIEIKYRPAAF